MVEPIPVGKLGWDVEGSMCEDSGVPS
jgi:hypothetical protein